MNDLTKPAAINELGDSELIKRINEQVGIDLAADRSTYTRAVALGEMLVLLRNRRNDKRGWQEYLKEKCPKLAYETATLYIRLFEKQDAILAAAKAQSVTVTDLTVRLARKLIAKPKPNDPKKPKKPMVIEEPAAEPKTKPITLEDYLRDLAADELFTALRQTYEEEQLRKLSSLLTVHLTKTVRPLAERPSLNI